MTWLLSGQARRITQSCLSPSVGGCARLNLLQARAFRTSATFNIHQKHRNYNPRNNEGYLNKGILAVTTLSRRSVVMTLGKFDKIWSTNYCDNFFRFSRKMCKGYWRWYACFVTTKNVLWQNGGKCQDYRELVEFNLVLDSMRGLPVITCMFIPGGFIMLGFSLYLLPTWFVLPRTFWNRTDIQMFVKRQYTERHAAVPTIQKFLDSLVDGKMKDKDGKLVEVNLDTIPYSVLRALASGHGFYLSTKIPIPSVLRFRLARYSRNISRQDKMLKRDCLVHYLTQRELDWACYRRGFFPQKMMDFQDETIPGQRIEQEKFLLDWIRMSDKIDPETEATRLLFPLMLSETLPRQIVAENEIINDKKSVKKS